MMFFVKKMDGLSNCFFWSVLLGVFPMKNAM